MAGAIDYSNAGPLTGLDGIARYALASVAGTPSEVCFPVHGLVIQPGDAETLGLPAERFSDNYVRPAAQLVEALLALDPASLSVLRRPARRVVGTCRHFALLGCALLRYRRVPARVRCGFATYFQHGYGLDHWITEYRDDDQGRWVRIDPEILGQAVLDHPEDLRPGEFLTGGEAWSAVRRGKIDASLFGVDGTDNWGPGEIRGNAVKDLAALNKVEMLPWDVWGRMEEAYESTTGPDYDELLDTVAAICAADDLDAIAALYTRNELRVPQALIR